MEVSFYNLDLSEPENVKQQIINNFNNNGLVIQKIRKSKLGGYYIYHQFGTQHTRTVRKLVEKISDSEWLYCRSKKNYNVDFISDENKEELEDGLHRAICEALNRKE